MENKNGRSELRPPGCEVKESQSSGFVEGLVSLLELLLESLLLFCSLSAEDDFELEVIPEGER